MTVHRENSAGDVPAADAAEVPAFRDLRTLPGSRSPRGGAHRVPQPPHAVKGRAAVVAVAAGAVVAAGQTLTDGATGSPAADSSDAIALASGSSMILSDIATGTAQAADNAATALEDAATPANAGAGSVGGSAQVLAVPEQVEQAAETARQLAAGARYAAERAAAEAMARRPLYVKPASGQLTSHYGNRWGAIHGGIDIANAIGTPIYAATDGEVIDAGPASGFGQWIRVRADDGTVTVYGHIETIEVSEGQRVLAGDEIAKMGNRGFSTGPHLHFEVWENGTQRIDPQPWLAQRGISVAG